MVPSAVERLNAARHAFACSALAALPPAELGKVMLRGDQRRTVARARSALSRDGGCLIAEEVGRGKTYVALALAREHPKRLVVAPAALRSTWAGAMERAGVRCDFL